MFALIALSIITVAAIANAVRCRREVARLRDEATEARFVRASEVHAHGAQTREDAATIYRLTAALDEARRLPPPHHRAGGGGGERERAECAADP